MSGGYFNYDQHAITSIITELEALIKQSKPGEHSTEVLKVFEKALYHLKIAEIYTQRIDWLVSGDDDGEESFFKRLKSELADITKEA